MRRAIYVAIRSNRSYTDPLAENLGGIKKQLLMQDDHLQNPLKVIDDPTLQVNVVCVSRETFERASREEPEATAGHPEIGLVPKHALPVVIA
jgi:hypothetical protein